MMELVTCVVEREMASQYQAPGFAYPFARAAKSTHGIILYMLKSDGWVEAEPMLLQQLPQGYL